MKVADEATSKKSRFGLLMFVLGGLATVIVLYILGMVPVSILIEAIGTLVLVLIISLVVDWFYKKQKKQSPNT